MKTLIFIAGVEGSGTTLLLRMLSKLRSSVAVGGAYNSRFFTFHRWLCNRASDRFWAFPRRSSSVRALSFFAMRVVIGSIWTRYIVYKRSYPFNNMKYFPDINDISKISKNTKVIWMRRDLESNARSILRRGFVDTLGEATERTQAAINMLEQQARLFGRETILEIAYEDFIDPIKKECVLKKIANFIDADEDDLVGLSYMIERPASEALERK